MFKRQGESGLFSIAVSMVIIGWVLGFIPKQVAFQFLTSDKVLLDIYEVKDSLGLLDGYTAHVKTPVCEDGSCYEVELDFYWDVLGDFIRFEYDPQKPLTKLDHKPFESADYQKLQRILETTSPSFIHLRREELVMKPAGNTDDVDAMTGATVQSVKADMVEGAIFTCYTLWHIANGGIIFEIEEHTRKTLNKELISKFFNSGDSRLVYFLVEKMYPDQYASNFESLLSVAEDFEPFYISRMLDRMPVELFEESLVQRFFAQRLDKMDMETQSLFLERMSNARLTSTTSASLINEIQPQRNRSNDLIIEMLVRYAGNDARILEEMLTQIRHREVTISPGSYGLLQEVVKDDRKLRKMIKGLLRE